MPRRVFKWREHFNAEGPYYEFSKKFKEVYNLDSNEDKDLQKQEELQERNWIKEGVHDEYGRTWVVDVNKYLDDIKNKVYDITDKDEILLRYYDELNVKTGGKSRRRRKNTKRKTHKTRKRRKSKRKRKTRRRR